MKNLAEARGRAAVFVAEPGTLTLLSHFSHRRNECLKSKHSL